MDFRDKQTDRPTGAELVNPYDDIREKSGQVEEMFDSIAPAYDFMNTAMTFGLHNTWRRKALTAATSGFAPAAQLSILDIATGTGDVAFELHERFRNARVVGLDLSEGMLGVARAKLAKCDAEARRLVSFEQGDSLHMRFGDSTFDIITVAYGVRNFERIEQGLREMARVLKPGGTLCIIELSEPTGRITLPMYRLYSRHLIPLVGRLVSGDSRAYSYLSESIAAAPQRDRMTALMTSAGLSQCRWRSLTFGAVTYYIATRQDDAK